MSSKKRSIDYVAEDVLVRAIHPANIDKGLITSAAFECKVKQGKKETYLSVACQSLDTLEGIARCLFNKNLSQGKIPILTASRKIKDYNKTAEDNKIGLKISRNRTDGYIFEENGNQYPAYTHEPTKDFKAHSGIHFVRVLNDAKEKTFASLMRSINPKPDQTVIEIKKPKISK